MYISVCEVCTNDTVGQYILRPILINISYLHLHRLCLPRIPEDSAGDLAVLGHLQCLLIEGIVAESSQGVGIP